jgi:hypothetical protein
MDDVQKKFYAKKLRQTLAAVDEALVPLGFVGHGRTGNRTSGELIDVIDIQKFSFAPQITSNFGVFYPWAHTVFEPWQDFSAKERTLGPVIYAPEATVTVRMEELMTSAESAGGLRDWGHLGNDSVVEAVSGLILERVVPFLDAMHNSESAEDYMLQHILWYTRKGTGDAARVVQVAALKYHRGDVIGACNLLEEVKKRWSTHNPPWEVIDGLLAMWNKS